MSSKREEGQSHETKNEKPAPTARDRETKTPAVSHGEYYSLLSRAIGALPQPTAETARRAVYGRARKALSDQLRGVKAPAGSARRIDAETRALEDAVSRLEAEIAAKSKLDSSRGIAPSLPTFSSKPAPDPGPGTPEQQAAAQEARPYAAIGKVVSILAKTPELRGCTLGDIEDFIVPALIAGQALLIEAPVGNTGPPEPVAVILWASVSPEVDGRLSKNIAEPFRLAPDEWKCGEIPWLVLVAGEARMIPSALNALWQNILQGRSLKTRTKDKSGKAVIGVFPDNARGRDL